VLVVLLAAAAITVVDGDTIKVGDETVRLWGIDAPDGRQACCDVASVR
jgi:endonuclease YncB( thermonuclease family)